MSGSVYLFLGLVSGVGVSEEMSPFLLVAKNNLLTEIPVHNGFFFLAFGQNSGYQVSSSITHTHHFPHPHSHSPTRTMHSSGPLLLV